MKDSSNQSIFHCQYNGCLYFEGSERYFTTKKNLNQHIVKVHAEKKHFCTKCQKGFSNEWFRKNHEKSCESKWKCSCGLKYQYRESLLTHVRRSQHVLPEDILSKKKTISKPSKKEDLNSNPLIVIIQPTVAYIPYKPTLTKGERFILPKQNSQPLLMNFNLTQATNNNNSEVNNFSSEQTNVNNIKLHSSTESEANNFHANTKQKRKSVAETQTCDSFKSNKTSYLNKRNLESRGSQCTVPMTKKKVKHTCTQTMESAVVKMKKKKTRKKSVAVDNLWSDLENFLFSKDIDNGSIKSDKYSSSTQTSPASEKVLRDSQTLTDNLFHFPWPDGKESNMDNTFPLLAELTHNNVTATDVFSDSEDDHALDWLAKSTETCTTPQIDEVPNITDASNSILSSIFGNCFPSVSDKNQLNEKFSSNMIPSEKLNISSMLNLNPENSSAETLGLSDTQTQTIANMFDYDNIFTNMETQTTDDFIFSDMEFLDTETQTPWNDSLPVDHLSIESQTDFSSLMSEYVPEFPAISNANLSNTDFNKVVVGRHMETQTQDVFKLPELTNSEAQTLFGQDYFFT